MSRVEVMIAGSSYTITGQESREYLISLASFVNDEINRLIESDVVQADKVNVLAALNIADKLFKNKRDVDLEKNAVKERDVLIEKLQGEIRANKKEILQKEKEIEKLKNSTDLKDFEKKIEEIKKKYEEEIKKKDQQLDEAMKITEETFEKFYNLQLKIAKYEIGMKRDLNKTKDKKELPKIRQIEIKDIVKDEDIKENNSSKESNKINFQVKDEKKDTSKDKKPINNNTQNDKNTEKKAENDAKK